MFEGINQGLRNLRQLPVEVEHRQNDSRQVDQRGVAPNVEQRSLPPPQVDQRSAPSSMDHRGMIQEIPINRTQGQSVHQSAGPGQGQPSGQGHEIRGQSGRREIPIQVVTGTKPAQSHVIDTTPASPRLSQAEKEKKKADLEKRRIDLERDIDNVIFEAIKQVPGYDKQHKQSQPSQMSQAGPAPQPPKRAESVKSEPIKSELVRKESAAEEGEEEVFEQQQIADRKVAMQTFWKALERNDKTDGNQVSAYGTLPHRKRTQSDERKHKHIIEAEPGSYQTLPSFGHKTKQSPKPTRRAYQDLDMDYSFSDVEGGRSKSQSSWRPSDSPLQSRHIWKPILPPKENTHNNSFIQPESPGLKQKRVPQVEAPPPRRTQPQQGSGGQQIPIGIQGQQMQANQGYPSVGEQSQHVPIQNQSQFVPVESQYQQQPVQGQYQKQPVQNQNQQRPEEGHGEYQQKPVQIQNQQKPVEVYGQNQQQPVQIQNQQRPVEGHGLNQQGPVEGHGQMHGQDQSLPYGSQGQLIGQPDQQPPPPARNFIPIPIQYEQKQRTGNMCSHIGMLPHGSCR